VSKEAARIEAARRAYVAALGTKDEGARRADLENEIAKSRIGTQLKRLEDLANDLEQRGNTRG
jgi:hypothetical protein